MKKRLLVMLLSIISNSMAMEVTIPLVKEPALEDITIYGRDRACVIANLMRQEIALNPEQFKNSTIVLDLLSGAEKKVSALVSAMENNGGYSRFTENKKERWCLKFDRRTNMVKAKKKQWWN